VPDPRSWYAVEKGWKVVAADGNDVGTVHEVLGDTAGDIFDGLTVSQGVGSNPLYVPSEAVGEIVEGEVKLSLAKDQIDGLTPYRPGR
jgi:ribosomal 30S subunit maturation factor RimM